MNLYLAQLFLRTLKPPFFVHSFGRYLVIVLIQSHHMRLYISKGLPEKNMIIPAVANDYKKAAKDLV
ncbi:MAG: hypothetical protein ACOX3W_09045 [Christensenellaceae bacterium]|jgi:hypothetical protein